VVESLGKVGEKKKLEKKKEQEQLNRAVVTNPNANIVTILIEECTPLATIPGNISYTSQELGLDEVVVVVGDYYYSKKTRDIERRTTKRKRGEVTLKQESTEMSIKWKAEKIQRKMLYKQHQPSIPSLVKIPFRFMRLEKHLTYLRTRVAEP
jgi:hypothetical protein